MGRLRGIRGRWKSFVGGISAIGGIGYLMLAIMESGKISEAQKYFALTLILFILMLIYIETVVKPRSGG